MKKYTYDIETSSMYDLFGVIPNHSRKSRLPSNWDSFIVDGEMDITDVISRYLLSQGESTANENNSKPINKKLLLLI